MADSTAATENSSDSGSVFAPDQLDNSDGESGSPLEIGDLEMDDLDMEKTNLDKTDMETSDKNHDASSDQMAANVDLYTGQSGMALVVVDCFEELFTGQRFRLDHAREIREAVKSGMDPKWNLLAAARAHRALNDCMKLGPQTKLYERLFVALASALVKAFEIKESSFWQQKCVFLLESTPAFEVLLSPTSSCTYYFDGLCLVDPLFNADFLITKLIHKHIAYARWLNVQKPDDLDEKPEADWQWTSSAEPQASGGGRSDGHPPKPEAKSNPEGTQQPAPGPPVTPRGRRANAADQQPKSNQRRDSFSPRDKNGLLDGVAKYGGKYSEIYNALQRGEIQADVPDRSQATIRTHILLLKVRILQQDKALPKGFDSVKLDKPRADMVSKVGKNPYRKESDVDSQGQPTNTQWNAAQGPLLKEVGLSRL